MQKTSIFLVASALSWLISGQVRAQQPEPEISSTVLHQAVDVLAEYFEGDLEKISKITKKTSVLNYTQSDELPHSIKSYLFKKIQKIANENRAAQVQIVECIECTSIRAEAEGDEILIKKGINDRQELSKTMKRLGINKYLDVNLTHGGRYLILQMTLLDQDGIIAESLEYKTPLNAFNDSQWVFGAGFEGVFFTDNKMPSPKAYRLHVGQRLFGYGIVGLSAMILSKTDWLESIKVYSGYFDLSHNEIFASYWDIMQLFYVAELGVTDFNGKQQLTEGLGVKAKFGQYFTLRLLAHANQFISKPDDDTDIFNPDGEAVLKNSDPLPVYSTLGIGVEF